MSKPGFVKKRIIQLFESNDVETQQKIVDNYNKLTNFTIEDFKVFVKHIDEKVLKTLL